MEIKKCPFCSEEILSTAKKCKHCGEMVEETSNPVAKQEKEFFNDGNVLVTNTRFVNKMYNKTYSMANISAVALHRLKNDYKKLGIILIISGIFLFSMAMRQSISQEHWITGIAAIIVGILLCLIKDKYVVRLTSTSGVEEEFFISKDKKILQEIVDSVNEAIIHRG